MPSEKMEVRIDRLLGESSRCKNCGLLSKNLCQPIRRYLSKAASVLCLYFTLSCSKTVQVFVSAIRFIC
jgi:hypothetical protein